MRKEDLQPPDYFSEELKAAFIEYRDFLWGEKWEESERKKIKTII